MVTLDMSEVQQTTTILPQIKILIADENADSRRQLVASTERAGAQVEIVSDGRAALNLLRSDKDHAVLNPFHIAILSISLPIVDGYTLGAVIRDNSAFESTRMILLSDTDSAITEPQWRRQGFKAHLLRPLDDVSLNQQLDRLIALPQPSTKSILIAEDNIVNQKLASLQLKTMGYDPVAANNGQETLDLALHGDYALILMDCNMPVMDGYEAARKIRESEQRLHKPRVPIIAMTASSLPKDRQACRAAGMDDFIAKPVRMEQLAEVMNRWLFPGAENKAAGAEVAPLPTAAAIDLSVISALRNGKFAIDTANFQEIVTVFLENVPQLLTQMQSGAAQGRAEGVRNAAHQLASSAAYLGANRLSQLAKALELQLISCSSLDESGDGTTPREKITQLCAEFESRVCPTLKSTLHQARI